MIFYFSGTGNSKHVADCIDDSRKINISEAAKNNEYSYVVDKDEAVGFIMPVYYSGIPKTVIDFIRNLNLSGDLNYIYGVLTHGGGPGGAGTMLQKELKKKNYTLHACFDVSMTSNYIMFGDLRPDDVIIKELKDAEVAIEKIKAHISGKEAILPNWTAIDSFLTSSMKFLCDNYMSAKKFHPDEGCNSCGNCVKNCPSGLIKMIDGKPVWKEKKCVRCMACLKCPHVQFNNKSSERRRYNFDKYYSQVKKEL